MRNTKALPPDVDKFFQGASTFFEPNNSLAPQFSSEDQLANAAKASGTERSNGRAVIPHGRTVEQVHGDVDRMHGKIAQRINGSAEQTKESVMKPSSHLSELASGQISPTMQRDNEVSPHQVISSMPGTTVVTGEEMSRPGVSILERLKQGKSEPQELTERYSFEIYRRQKEEIEDFLYTYKKKTGERLSASRLIREAITLYFHTLTRGETQ